MIMTVAINDLNLFLRKTSFIAAQTNQIVEKQK